MTRLRLDEHTGNAIYADDCGAWNNKTSTSTRTTYALVDGRLVFLSLCDGKYCIGGRRGVWRPLQPQPQPTDIVRATRHYATLKDDASYRKRVTWFSNVPGCDKVAVVEYQGVRDPAERPPHGNARRNARPFERTHPDTLRHVDEKVKHREPQEVYDSMTEEGSVHAPRDVQQVYSCNAISFFTSLFLCSVHCQRNNI